MATVAHSESRRHYSWWWNSHISPKNSKWLQENLTDMDTKVKAMIKLIEEDADSFARRAEMYYKKRPELMKLVEEFYRAYRALAERYDHATGALRQAHRTMAEAFPNQIPLVLSDDSPHGSSTSEVEPHTPEMPPPVRALFDPDELQKDALGFSSDIHVIKRNGAYSEEINSLSNKKGLKQLTGMSAIGDGAAHITFTEGRIRKGLNFQEEEEDGFDTRSHKGSKEAQHAKLKQDRTSIVENLQQDNARLLTENQNLKSQLMEESDRTTKAESEVKILKQDRSKIVEDLQKDNDRMLIENQNLKGQLMEESERAMKAESGVQILKDALSKLNSEKDANHLQYQVSLERISMLESQLSNTQNDLKKLNEEFINVVQKLKDAEKLNKSLQFEVGMLEERATMQDSEIQSLKDALAKLRYEKEADHLEYLASLQKISVLETQLSITENDLKKLNSELVNNAQKLMIAEQLNQSLQFELHVLEKRAKIQEDEIKGKHCELDKLHVALQDKHQQCVQAEMALHSNEKLLVISKEEICVLKEENCTLNEDNLQCTFNVKNLKEEIMLLKDQKDKIKYEVGVSVKEKEMLNQELLQLKEDKMDRERRHQNLIDQMKATVTTSESLQAEIKDLKERCKEHEAERMVAITTSESLQADVKDLKERCKDHEAERMLLIEKLKHFDNISEKNMVLEISLMNANIELETLRRKLAALDYSHKSLRSEKDLLVCQLETLTLEVEKLSERSKLTENSLSDANTEIEHLIMKLKDFEESCQSLECQNSTLMAERNNLFTRVEKINLDLENITNGFAELQSRHSTLSRELNLSNNEVKELQSLLELEKHGHLHSISTMNDLQDEIIFFKDQIIKLEDQVSHCVRENEILLQENVQLKEDKNHLANKQLGLTEQINAVEIASKSLHGVVKDLEQKCKEYEDEKLLSQEKLKYMDNVIEKNGVLEKSLRDADSELKVLKEKLDSLNFEKDSLVSQVQILSHDREKLLDENAFMEKSLFDMDSEIESLSGKLKDLEESCQLLNHQKSAIITEKNNLIAQLDSITLDLRDTTSRFAELQDQHSSLSKERELSNNQIKELQSVLELERQERLRSTLMIKDLQNEMIVLKDRKSKLEEEVGVHVREKEALNAEFVQLEEHKNDLERRHKDLTEKVRTISSTLESHEEEIKDMKERGKKQETAKMLLMDQHSSLLRERDLSNNQIKELQTRLELEKQENLCSTSMIKDLQDEIILLKDRKTKLEEEVEIHVREKETLNEEFMQLKEDGNVLERRNQDIMEQMTAISLTLEFHKEEIKDMKERCKDHEAEKVLLMEKLQFMDNISEENVLLKNSLRDANGELEILREKLASLNDLHEFLTGEKDSLVCRVQTLTQEKEDLSEKNTFLEYSLSNLNNEVEHLSRVLKELEESCQLLNHENSALMAERCSLASQVERITLDLRNMTGGFVELQDQHSNLSREWDLSTNQIKELQDLLELNKLEHVLFTLVIKDLHDEKILLKDQKTKIEDEAGLCVREKETLKLELVRSQGDRNDLERRYQDLMEQMKAVSFKSESLEMAINELKEKCKEHEAENKRLLEKLKFLDSILENNVVLEATLTDANAEIEVLEEKLAALDNSHKSLKHEKDVLISQVHSLTDNVEKLLEERTFLEVSLCDVSSEVEHVSMKLKGCEDSCRFLNDQNSALTAEKNSLISQVERITLDKENITSRLAELQDQHLSLSREWDLSTNEVKHLHCLLELEKEAHQTTIMSYKSQLITLENKISLLQKQNQLQQKELEAGQTSLFCAMITKSVLQETLCDVQERNLILSLEGQKHLEASSRSEALASQLEQEKVILLGKLESLTECNQELGSKIHQLSSIIGTDQDSGSMDEIQDVVLLEIIIIKIKKLLTCASETDYDCQHLHLEVSIFVTLMGHIAVDLANIRVENVSLQQELEKRTERISSLQQKQLELLGLNEKLEENVDASNHREQALKAEAKVLCKLSNEFQEALQKSKTQIVKLLEENNSLSEELSTLKQKHVELEEAHVDVLVEAMQLDQLYLLFQSVSAERSSELISFSKDLNSLHSVKTELQSEVNRLNEKVHLLEVEKVQFVESIIHLQEELKVCLISMELEGSTARIIFEDLDLELQHMKNQLIHKDIQLSEANLKVLSTQADNMEVHQLLKSLNKENEEAKLVEEEMSKRISNLSELVAQRNYVISNLHEANEMMQKGTDKMQKELEALVAKEKSLRSELQKEAKELMNYEMEFGTLLSEHHNSTVQAAICEEKLHELLVEIETRSLVEKQFLTMEIDFTKNCMNELNKKLCDLAEENREAKADMKAYLSLVKSLWACISSLEAKTMSMPNIEPSSEHEKEVLSCGSGQHHYVSQPSESHEGIDKADVLELEKLIAKAESLHEVLIFTRKLVEQQRLDSSSNIKAARKENEEPRKLLGNDDGIDDAAVSQGKYMQTMKDISLDQVASSVPYRDEGSYELPKKGGVEIDDQLWETAETESKNHKRKASLMLNEHDIETVKAERSECPSSELVAEKELSIDKLEISSSELTSKQTWKDKITKRLESDALRLSTLRMSLDELKGKMENLEMRKLPASFGYDPIKAQLNNAEAAALELISINTDLAKKTEEFSSLDVIGIESKERYNTGRKQVSEQAKRESEKVGRLELELQKIQYVLLKMEEELENRRSKAAERKTRVLLRDYLYGRKGKMRCCGCVKPKTNGD